MGTAFFTFKHGADRYVARATGRRNWHRHWRRSHTSGRWWLAQVVEHPCHLVVARSMRLRFQLRFWRLHPRPVPRDAGSGTFLGADQKGGCRGERTGRGTPAVWAAFLWAAFLSSKCREYRPTPLRLSRAPTPLPRCHRRVATAGLLCFWFGIFAPIVSTLRLRRWPCRPSAAHQPRDARRRRRTAE